MNSEETEITLRLKIRYGYDPEATTPQNAQADAIGLAVNPDFMSVPHGTYLNGVVLTDENDHIIVKF